MLTSRLETQPNLQHQTVDYEKGIAEFAEKAFRTKMPILIAFTMGNTTIIKLLRHLRRHATGSIATAYQYVYGVWRWSQWLDREPDKILAECYGPDGEPLPKMLAKHAQLVDDFVGHLQELGLAPGTVSNHAKGVKQLYRANGLILDLPRYPRTEQYPGRAPTQDEFHQLLKVADPFERLLILLPATGGFREGTVAQLRYSNLREDLEREKDPVLVTVQPAITKGKGWETGGYWTFLPHETIDTLKECLEIRRRGGRGFEPEVITDNSPILRCRNSGKEVRPIGPQAIWFTVNQLYKKAGIIKACPNKSKHQRKGPLCANCGYPKLTEKRKKLSFHSLRWFFRTQMTSQGVDREYAEFMMGHKRPAYNDIRSKGPDFLHDQYMKADFGITPKPKLSDREVIEALLRAKGYNPAKLIRTDAFDGEGYSEPHRVTVEDWDARETRQLVDFFARTVLDEANGIISSKCSGSPGEIRTPVDGSPPGSPKPITDRVIVFDPC